MEAQAVKQCCARFYASDGARLLLGDSFHPGGDRLTARLGYALHLCAHDRVLDVACGNGRTAFILAQKFGCSVVGVDYSADNIRRATRAARAAGLSRRVTFVQGDAEALPAAPGSFSALVCECAFCTFPDKAAGAWEMRRVLAPGGRLGLADITLEQALPPELQSLAAWVLCIADARPADGYCAILAEAGLTLVDSRDESWAIRDVVNEMGSRLMLAEAAQSLGGWLGIRWDFGAARAVLRQTKEFVETGGAGYVLLTAKAEAQEPAATGLLELFAVHFDLNHASVSAAARHGLETQPPG
ncbi:MAG TPA: class I SAM-dependent methyltransferase [Gammaproteobacteria bacterium]